MEQNKKLLSDGQLPGQQTIFHNMMLDIVSNAGVDEAFLMFKDAAKILDKENELNEIRFEPLLRLEAFINMQTGIITNSINKGSSEFLEELMRSRTVYGHVKDFINILKQDYGI